MGIFDRLKKGNTSKPSALSAKNVVWRNRAGAIVCPGDSCPQTCDKSCPIWLNTMSAMMLKANKADEALPLMKRALEIAPDFYDVWNNLGAVYGQKGQYEEAYDCYKKAHELCPERTSPIFGLAMSSKDLGRLIDAQMWCDQYDKICSDGRCDGVREAVEQMISDIHRKDDHAFITSADGKWRMFKESDDYYFMNCAGSRVKTPNGADVHTPNEILAKRILADLEQYGLMCFSPASILPWHYTYIDNFSRMSHEKVEDILYECFVTKLRDWTFDVDTRGNEWSKYFTDSHTRIQQFKDWMKKATIMQLTAICCIGNAYRSINIAFVLATIMERFTGDERHEKFRAFAEFLNNHGPFIVDTADFYTFELYYGIHFDENGSILGNVVVESNEIEGDDLDIDNLAGNTVTIEQLVGRNYYHYTDGEIDTEQPARYSLEDVELDESDDEDEEDEEDEDEYDENGDELCDYLPSDCWVKRFVDEEDPNTCYLLYLVVDDGGRITESGCIEETSHRVGGVGGMTFLIPGVELPCAKTYDDALYPPEKVKNDLRLLFTGRCLPLHFSFIDKRVPQKMIDEGGNGGSNTEYTYALQSVYRLAYTDMYVETDEDGVIEGFEYSTYQSSGSAYGDMFSRPMPYSDRRDEAIDSLLYIYDMYTDEEIASMQ